MKKSIKVYAVVDKESNQIECGEFFAELECPASYCPPILAIFASKKEAKEVTKGYDDVYKIVEVNLSMEI